MDFSFVAKLSVLIPFIMNKKLEVMLNEKRRFMVNGDRTRQKEVQKRIIKETADSEKVYKKKIEDLFKTNSTKGA